MLKSVNGDASPLDNNGYHSNGRTHHGSIPAVQKHTQQYEAITTAVRTILENIGENPERDGLIGTPDRVARAYDELFSGYQTDPVKLLNNALFDVEYDDMVIVKDIEFFSMCEHHMLPFQGRAHVAYLPRHKVVGLSKIPRLVDMFARRLQIQERMTHEIAAIMDELLDPRGVAVVVEASHMCAQMRGVEKEHAYMVTTAMLGEFKDDKALRDEFMDHLRRQRPF